MVLLPSHVRSGRIINDKTWGVQGWRAHAAFHNRAIVLGSLAIVLSLFYDFPSKGQGVS